MEKSAESCEQDLVLGGTQDLSRESNINQGHASLRALLTLRNGPGQPPYRAFNRSHARTDLTNWCH